LGRELYDALYARTGTNIRRWITPSCVDGAA